MENNHEEKSERGFTISDKRFTSKSEEEKQEVLKHETPKEEKISSPPPQQEAIKQDTQKQQEPPIEVTFSGLIFSLSHSALIQMGEVPDPITNKKETNITAAKQSIDLIALLEEKTKGNLDREEEMLIKNALYDLRMRFVQASKPK